MTKATPLQQKLKLKGIYKTLVTNLRGTRQQFRVQPW